MSGKGGGGNKVSVKRVVKGEDLASISRIADQVVVRRHVDGYFEVNLIFCDAVPVEDEASGAKSEYPDSGLVIEIFTEEELEREKESMLDISFDLGLRSSAGKTEGEVGKKRDVKDDPDKPDKVGEKEEGEREERERNTGWKKKDIKSDDGGWVNNGNYAYRIKNGILEAKYGSAIAVRLPLDTAKKIFDDLPEEATLKDLEIVAANHGVRLSKKSASALARAFTNVVFDAEIVGGGKGRPLLIVKHPDASVREELRGKLRVEKEVIGGCEEV